MFDSCLPSPILKPAVGPAVIARSCGWTSMARTFGLPGREEPYVCRCKTHKSLVRCPGRLFQRLCFLTLRWNDTGETPLKMLRDRPG